MHPAYVDYPHVIHFTAASVADEHSPVDWCPRRDSNPEPTDYESAALTIELQGHNNLQAIIFGSVAETVATARAFSSFDRRFIKLGETLEGAFL